MIQAESIQKILTEAGHETEIIGLDTKGDQILDRPIDALGSRGVFVREVERALLNGEIDLAVHSLKDLPSQLPEGLSLANPPKAMPPEDVFVGTEEVEGLMDLMYRTVGTGSNRRKAQLRGLFASGIDIVPIRGNIETRMGKIESEQLDGVILARAGLIRGGYEDRIQMVVDPTHMIPSPCQGILGLEHRTEDRQLAELLNELSDPEATERMEIERTFQKTLGADCQSPIGIYCEFQGEELTLHGCYAENVDHPLTFKQVHGKRSEGISLARELAEELSHGEN